jgi:hypothetical protein
MSRQIPDSRGMFAGQDDTSCEAISSVKTRRIVGKLS